MSNEIDIWHLILDASLPVKGVMIILLLASITSWAVILQKMRGLRKVEESADAFEERFWSGADLGALYKDISSREDEISGLEGVFEAGFREFARLRQRRTMDPGRIVEGAQRAMRVANSREIDRLEHNLEFLATVGSVSPYIGLFGTVWGIMLAFIGLAAVREATIAMVAPGIAEALIATAMGLFAAIPAVIFYNRFSTKVDRLANRFETFQDEFSTILQRQVHLDE